MMIRLGAGLFERQQFGLAIPVAILALVATACAGRASPDLESQYVLQVENADLSQATRLILDALVEEISNNMTLEPGFPPSGWIFSRENPDDPGVMDMTCHPDEANPNSQQRCILLNDAGDFIEVSPIDYPSARVYMFEVYIVDPASSGQPDPTATSKVVINPHQWSDDDMLVDLLDAISAALYVLGAEPISFE